MVQPHFPVLPDATLTAINTVGEWLAQDDLRGTSQTPDVDGVILAGNAVITTIEAACRIAEEKQVPLLISGGIGHSTTFLYDAISLSYMLSNFSSFTSYILIGLFKI